VTWREPSPFGLLSRDELETGGRPRGAARVVRDVVTTPSPLSVLHSLRRPPRRPAQVSSAARVRAARRGPLHRGLGPAAGQRALRGPRQGALRVCARRRKQRRRELRRGGGGGGGDGGAAGRPAAARHARGGRSRALERAAAGARAAVVALARGGRWTRSRRPGASVAHAIALATECGGGRVGRAGSQGGQGLPAGGVARAPVRALPRDEGGGGRGRRLGPSAARRASADAAAAGPSSGGGGGAASRRTSAELGESRRISANSANLLVESRRTSA